MTDQPDPETSTTGASPKGGAATRPAVVVTGASEGIGLALAQTFAEAGHTLLMVSRDEGRISKVAREVAARHGVAAHALALDVTHPDAARGIAAALQGHGLHCEILINNAGIGLGGPFAAHERSDIARLLDLNVKAVSLLTRAVLPDMLTRRTGGIINIASLGGFAPGPYQAAYYASKAFVVSLSRALAEETRGTGVHVCVVTPGPVETAFHARMGADTAPYRYLMPALKADQVARATRRGWRLGLRVIYPGLLTPVTATAMRLTPWVLLVPIVGWLLGARYPKRQREPSEPK